MKGASLMMVLVVIAAAGFAQRTPAKSPEVTFTRDVAPILHANCVRCHRPGEVAPMSLRTYEEARPYARAIKEKVVGRKMPPWSADRTIGTFTNDPSLSPEQIATIAQWVDAGSPQGAASDMPELPHFPEGWQLGEPDLILELPEVSIPAKGRDIFPIPTVTLKLDEARWIQAVEIRPGNTAVAHHAVLFSGEAGLLTTAAATNVLAVWAAGSPPTVYPDGMGRKMTRAQVITANLHYHPNGTATTDRTRIGFHFGKGELKKEVMTGVAGNITFTIPPNAAGHELRGVYVADQDINVISFFPHMHLRGTDMRMTATFPDGRKKDLLNVPAYDFNWQLFYYPTEHLRLPRGTRVDVVAHYDNTSANRANPDPARAVRFGETTNDEMMFGTFEFIADAGVSPVPPDDRLRMTTLLAPFPGNESYVMTSPFILGTITSALHLPKSGDGIWYLAVRPGVVIDVPVQQVTWNGDAFRFTSELRAAGLGGALSVSGQVKPDGSIQGTVQPVGRGMAPFSTFSGSRR